MNIFFILLIKYIILIFISLYIKSIFHFLVLHQKKNSKDLKNLSINFNIDIRKLKYMNNLKIAS